MTGAKLAALVCKHMRAVFRAHMRALKNNVEYCATSETRSASPPSRQCGWESGGESATEDGESARQRMMMRCYVSTVLSEYITHEHGLASVLEAPLKVGTVQKNRFGVK